MLRCKGTSVLVVFGFFVLGLMSLVLAAPAQAALSPQELEKHLKKFIDELPPDAKELLAKSAAACPPGGQANVLFTTPANNNIVHILSQCQTACQPIVASTLNGDEICLKIFNAPLNATYNGGPIPDPNTSNADCNATGSLSGTFCFSPDYTQTGVFSVFFVAYDKITTCAQSRIVTFIVDCETVSPVISSCPTAPDAFADPVTCQAPVPDVTGGVIAADNCTPSQFLTIAQNPAAGTLVGAGPYTIIVTVTDACGNTDNCDVSFKVVDNTPPVVICPPNQEANSDPNQCGAVVKYPLAEVTDNCPGATVDCVPPSGSFFPVGATTVTCTATDAAQNTSTCTFLVTVKDAEAPQLACPAPGDIVAPTDPGRCDAVVQYAVGVLDNCDPNPTVVCVPPSGSVFLLGVTPVHCTATDAAGNVSSCDFDVTVFDREAPVATCPADITVGSDPNVCGAIVNYVVTATDNCDPIPSIQCSPTSGSSFPLGTTGVSCQVLDASGNVGFCNFNVTVTNAPPEVHSNDTAIFICGPTPICRPVFSSDPDGNLAQVFCDGQPVAPGIGQFCFTADTVGVYTFTCIAIDACGAQSALDFQFVVVTANQPPILTRSGPNLLARPQQLQRKGVE